MISVRDDCDSTVCELKQAHIQAIATLKAETDKQLEEAVCQKEASEAKLTETKKTNASKCRALKKSLKATESEVCESSCALCESGVLFRSTRWTKY